MKVVLFCGGYGMRMRNGPADDVPKPMQLVGPRPLLWHVMRYYAHFGHRDFVLALGYGARHIKDFFLTYTETASNDFVLHNGQVELLSTDISDWSITFVHTGIESPIGERLRRVREYVAGEEMFLANYADVLTDAPLDTMIDTFAASDAGASMMVVPPQSSFHCVELDGGPDSGASRVRSISSASRLPVWENAGFFVLRQEVFDHLPENGDLVEDACGTLAEKGRLLAYPYRGFWQPADTFKERAALDAAYESGERPWMLWEKRRTAGTNG
ncbi:glucose-1-phosphate cytidylyltransferase [Amycolatopsis rhizosphaerae]|uniref:Glucose-1-phosphate cytidylyltransferase n=1 Tax=Amycolatopsis rhizosphaerae TaxID=2053003 RepID=A0A558BQW0_9PSEU|nr:glucose-1-phosphate cytidylyltransferase [Amycolatopsis rhizosphaerae]TVT38891.1 glucose-1-phosphate cytidylyltransferase [Amycolatopsis rhizosphaerae]